MLKELQLFLGHRQTGLNNIFASRRNGFPRFPQPSSGGGLCLVPFPTWGVQESMGISGCTERPLLLSDSTDSAPQLLGAADVGRRSQLLSCGLSAEGLPRRRLVSPIS